MTARTQTAVVLMLSGLSTFSQEAAAQRVVGQVLDEATGSLVTGVVVTAHNHYGDIVAYGLSDDLGEFALDLPGVGRYWFEAAAAGYGRRSAPEISFDNKLPVLMRIELTPAPYELEGLTDRAKSEMRVSREIEALGLEPSQLDERLVTRQEIEARQSAFDFGSVLQWQQIPGMQVRRKENSVEAREDVICVSFLRGRSLRGERCSLTVWNGLVVTPDVASVIPLQSLESIVVLTPTEATLRYGTIGGGGAVLLFTRTR